MIKAVDDLCLLAVSRGTDKMLASLLSTSLLSTPKRCRLIYEVPLGGCAGNLKAMGVNVVASGGDYLSIPCIAYFFRGVRERGIGPRIWTVIEDCPWSERMWSLWAAIDDCPRSVWAH